jgi:hypothetical protein
MSIGITACGGDAEPIDQAAVDREMDLALEGEGVEPELADEPQGDVDELEMPAPPPAPPPAAPPVRQAPPPPPPPPAAPAEVEEPAEQPVEPDPEPATITLSADSGTEFRVRLRQELSTKDNKPGDRFTASVVEPLIDGSMVVVHTNAIVRGEVTAVQQSGSQGEAAVIKIAFLDVTVNGVTYPLSASVVEANPETEGRYSTGDKAARIGGGAVAGAILGRVLGGNAKGTIIGAAVGAAAGTAITLATEDVDAVLPAGSELRLRLDEPLIVTVADPAG